eukprot:g9309.t1
MVELNVVFNPSDDAEAPDLEDPVESSSGEDVAVPVTLPYVDQDRKLQRVPGNRRLAGTTEIDVLVLYTSDIYSSPAEEVQLVSTIVAGFSTVNEATVNSEIDLRFNLVRVAQSPYSQTTYVVDPNSMSSEDLNDELAAQRRAELLAFREDEDVKDIRDEVQADLVLLVGEFPKTCGLGYMFQAGRDDLGYSFMDDDCWDNFTHSHEMVHNLGCDHDRENTNPPTTSGTSYNHGWRYCATSDAIVTDALTCADIGETCATADECCSDYCGSAGVCANDICSGARGDLSAIGDRVCDPENNNAACEYDGGDCCECDCVEPICGDGDDACTTPAWSCVAFSEQGLGKRWFPSDHCPAAPDGITDDDLIDCGYAEGGTCLCTCREKAGTCGTGTGFDCKDPASTCVDNCSPAGGDLSTVGDRVCDPENNNAACEYDGGDCCECDCAQPLCGAGDNACTTPVWSCVDDPAREEKFLFTFGTGYCDTFTGADLGDCDYFNGAPCLCACREGADTCGTGVGFDCKDPASSCGPPTCDTNADCPVDGEECCPVKKVCEVPDTTNPLACGDPHMTGFRGQTFDFTGEDGEWYCLISDLPSMHLNMRVTTPVPSLPEITYITGLSIVTTDAEGFDHNIVIEVTNPRSLESACPAGVSPCLADGALSVSIDGREELLQPGTVSVATGVTVSAANLPGACRSFGFEKYWEKKKLEYAQALGRRLSVEQSFGEWVLGDPTATNMEECTEYVARATAISEEGMFEHQSEHASFQIVLPTARIRLSHGRLHQLPVRDPTNRFDLPDHTTWQMNMAVDHNDVSGEATGILGETLIPTLDDSGMPIMQGMGAIRGSQEDYRVAGALGVYFVQGEKSN